MYFLFVTVPEHQTMLQDGGCPTYKTSLMKTRLCRYAYLFYLKIKKRNYVEKEKEL